MSTWDTIKNVGSNLLTSGVSKLASHETQDTMEDNARSTASKVNENARTGMQTAASEINAQMEMSKAVREMQNAQAVDQMITNITNKCNDAISKLGA